MSLIQRPQFKEKYDNYIGGKFVAPVNGNYFDVWTPEKATALEWGRRDTIIKIYSKAEL